MRMLSLSEILQANKRGFREGYKATELPDEFPNIYDHLLLNQIYKTAYLRGMRQQWTELK
jgi:hypothetical protein